MSNARRDQTLITWVAMAIPTLIALLQGGPIGGMLLLIPGALSMLLPWRAFSMGFMLMVAYLSIYPFGIPFSPPQLSQVQLHFRMLDLVMIFTACVYLFANFRYWSLKSSAIPDGEAHSGPLRQQELDTTELSVFALKLGVALVCGCILWRVATNFRLASDDSLTLRSVQGRVEAQEAFLILAGILIPLIAVFSLHGWYSFWSRLRPGVARQHLLDMGWEEARSEYHQRELWRAWGRGHLDPADPLRFRLRFLLRILIYGGGVLIAIALSTYALRLFVGLLYNLGVFS
jgi:hypothetical protein